MQSKKFAEIHMLLSNYFQALNIILLPRLNLFSVSGITKTTTDEYLKNTSWGTINGVIRPMFATATSFRNSLWTNNTHFKDKVKCYTIAGTQVNTITRVNYCGTYSVIDLTYNNNGDGTVLSLSAGLGQPDFVMTKLEHTKLVQDDLVIFKIISLIQEETGEFLYNATGEYIGNVWPLGNTGRKMYALSNGNYELSTSGNAKFSYMDSGYYEKIVEYDNNAINATFEIDNFDTKEIDCIASSPERTINILQPSRVYSAEELKELNQD